MYQISTLFFFILFSNLQCRPVKLWHLKESNLAKAKEQTPILLLYYRVNDTNSTELLPALKEAITRMDKFGVNAAVINCTQYPKACKNDGIKKGSQLKYIPRRGNFVYKGDNNADGIFEWVEKNVAKSLRIFRTIEEVEELYPDLESIFIGWFSDRKNIEFQTYESCSSSPKEHCLYTAIIDPTVDSAKVEYRNLQDNWKEKFTGQWQWETVTRWMSDVQSPFVEELTSDNADRFHKSTTPLGILVYDGKTDDESHIRKIGGQVGKQIKKAVLPLLLDHSKHNKVAKTLGLDDSQIPGFTIIAPVFSYEPLARAHYPLYLDSIAKPVPNGTYPEPVVDEEWKTRHSNIDNTSIIAHCQAFLENRLPLLIRSQPSSVTTDALAANKPIIPVTGSTFNTTVLDKDKHAFVLFQTPWCSKCKRLLTQLEQLASEIQEIDAQAPPENRTDLLFATFDTTENDHWPYYHVEDYPTLFLFSKHSKVSAHRCNDIQSIEKIKRFLKERIPNFPIEPNQQLIEEDDVRQKKREKMEKKMGLDKKKKKYLFEDEL